MVFPSKKDGWMVIIWWGTMVVFLQIVYEAIIQSQLIISIVMFLIMIFLASTWFHTRYIIADGLLIISFGFVYKKTIPIQEITSIRSTKNPFSAPALSLNRLEINYGKYETILVSPKKRNGFLAELKKHHPTVQIINDKF